MDGEEAQEALLHQRFKPSQIRGEWFRPTQEILDFIAAEGTPYTAPVIELVWADKSPAESTWIDELRHMFRNGVSA
jgi:hypothetical protein